MLFCRQMPRLALRDAAGAPALGRACCRPASRTSWGLDSGLTPGLTAAALAGPGVGAGAFMPVLDPAIPGQSDAAWPCLEVCGRVSSLSDRSMTAARAGAALLAGWAPAAAAALAAACSPMICLQVARRAAAGCCGGALKSMGPDSLPWASLSAELG